MVSIVMMVLLAACGGENSENTGNLESADKPPLNTENRTMEKREEVEIVISTGAGMEKEHFENRYQRFIEAALPHIKVKLVSYSDGDDNTDFKNLIVAGQNVDLYFESYHRGFFHGAYMETQSQFDLTPQIKSSGLDLSHIIPSLIDVAKQQGDGEIWALPVEMNIDILYYNMDMFDKYGVDYLVNDMSWEEIFEVAKRFDRIENDIATVGLAIDTGNGVSLNAYSVPTVDPETGLSTFDQEIWKKIINPLLAPALGNSVYQTVVSKLGLIPRRQNFVAGEVAIYGQSLSPSMLENEIFNVGVVSYPTTNVNGKELTNQPLPTYWGIPNTAEHKDEAFEVLEYLVSNEFQLELAKMGILPIVTDPIVREAFGTDELSKDFNLSEAAFANEYAPLPIIVPHPAAAGHRLRNHFADIILGTTDINTAMRKAKEEADQLIKEAQQAQ